MKLIKNHPIWSSFILFIILGIIFICGYYCLHLNEHQNFESNLLYSVLALFFSTVLILLAYLKTQEAIEQSRINYLLRIDERWASPEIIRAREVIHKLYLDAKKLYPQYENQQIKPIIAQAIMDLNDDETQIEQFIKLLNFLDFLETIGYLHSREAITTEEVSELIGNSIIYFYDIFSIYIAYRRKTKDPGFYIKFEKLYLEIKTKKCVR
ncbi:DUF4760 domain-containing protein [Legionella cherrii]|uniref:DUF4760 domain-containing protein n=1 Tax=Legionella cherrii TaxID=28084 RepID=A0ABY6T4V4_9GAMM|nr:hypothetical protein [Legionella cherrii]VEB35513.1 Uncharacterised protein [Legionella cherrii]